MQGGALGRASVPHLALALGFVANFQDQRGVLLDSQTDSQGRKFLLSSASEFISRSLPFSDSAATQSPLETQDRSIYEQCP